MSCRYASNNLCAEKIKKQLNKKISDLSFTLANNNTMLVFKA